MPRAEKLKEFKGRILEDLEIQEDEGLVVHIKGGGSINFTTMMDCYTRTRRRALYKLMEEVHALVDKGAEINLKKLYKIVQKELTEIDNEPDPT